MDTSTDTAPRIDRCSGRRKLVLTAGSGTSLTTVSLHAYTVKAAADVSRTVLIGAKHWMWAPWFTRVVQ